MKFLFIHQNMPGQFRHVASALAANPANKVLFVTNRGDRQLPGVRRLTYGLPPETGAESHPYLGRIHSAVRYGQAVADVLLALHAKGFSPDIVVGHPGWGESLFVRDIFPRAPYLNYCEFYYGPEGRDYGFDPAHRTSQNTRQALRLRATPLLSALEACDRGLSPTYWQRSTHPTAFQSKIDVIHEGVDVDALRPIADARFILDDGRVLTRNDSVVTYVARNLERTRKSW